MYILADGIVFTVGRPASRRGASCGLRPPPPGSTVASLPILSSTSSKRVSPQPPAFVIHAQGCTARDPEDPPIDPGLARMPAQRRMPALDRDHVRRHRGGRRNGLVPAGNAAPAPCACPAAHPSPRPVAPTLPTARSTGCAVPGSAPPVRGHAPARHPPGRGRGRTWRTGRAPCAAPHRPHRHPEALQPLAGRFRPAEQSAEPRRQRTDGPARAAADTGLFVIETTHPT